MIRSASVGNKAALPLVLGLALALWSLAPPSGSAHAQALSAPLMAEPIGYTDVADALDEDDPFDVNVLLGFRHVTGGATIQREVADERTVDGRSTRNFIDVAEHELARNQLDLGIEIGLYHDLMLFARVPIVLGETSSLGLPNGLTCQDPTSSEVCTALQEPVPGSTGGSREELFDLSGGLDSAKRSGVPELNLGVAWGVTNQQRGPTFATWVLRVEGSLATDSVMTPCVDAESAAQCSPGVSRGTSTLAFESRFSYRYHYLEPFYGVGHRIEWATTGEDLFTPAGELAGDVDPTPPSQTYSTLGVAFIPWEDRGRFQRFAVELRGNAAYISEGRDFTPLFDALGTSGSDYLDQPNFDRTAAVSEPATAVPFTGLTHVQEHARFSLGAQLVMQAARYVRFSLGFLLRYTTPHLLTGEQPCNLGVDPEAGDPRIGSCAEGITNPSYRAVIDAPGQRFRIADQTQAELSISALGQF